MSFSIKFLKICSILALTVLPSAAVAETCQTGFDFGDIYTGAKKKLAAGLYAEFFDLVSEVSGVDLDADVQAASEKLKTVYPEGFVGCKQILMNVHSDDFVSEVMVYFDAKGSAVYLLTDAVRLTSDWRVMRFRLTGDFEEVSALIR